MTFTPHAQGYETPVYRSLAEPILLGGVPRPLAIFNGTLSAAIGLGLQQWVAGLVLFVVCHLLVAYATRHDPDFLSCLMRHIRQKGHLAC